MRQAVIEDGAGRQFSIEAPSDLFEMVALTAPKRPLTFRVTYWEDGTLELEVWHQCDDGTRWQLTGFGASLLEAVRTTEGWQRWTWDGRPSERERIE